MVRLKNTNLLSLFRKQVGISKAEEKDFVDAFQTIFEEALFRDKILKINGLGTFKLVPVESRKSVNVNTGEEIEIAGHYKLTFLPDTSLKEKVNESLAHLEIVELDVDTVEQAEEIDLSNQIEEVASSSIELGFDDPLQKLTEQAIELKGLLADIQGDFHLSNEEPDVISSMSEENPEKVEEYKKEEKVIVEIPKQEEISDDKLKEKQVERYVSARDVVAEINREDSATNSSNSKFWILIAVFLFVTIIGLLGYQNREFFINDTVVEKDQSVDNFIVDVDIATSFVVESNNSQDSIELVESVEMATEFVDELKSDIDTLSPIYSKRFADVFNKTRKYTEFIDVVTLNEGSRLTWISLNQYGHKDYWVYIYEANSDIIKNPNAIKVGTKVRIPKLDAELIDFTNSETIEYARFLHDIYVKK